MKRHKTLYIFLLLLFLHTTANAQLQKVIKDIFSTDTALTHTDSSAIQKTDAAFKLKAGQIQKLDSLHQETVAQLRGSKLHENWWETGKHALYFMLVLLGQYLLFRLSSWLYQKAKARIQQLKDTKLKPISIQNYELLDTQKQVKLLVFMASIIRYLLLFILLVLTIPILFSIFPQTKELAYKIAYYIWNPVKSILVGILDYIPNLFTIIVICLTIKYIIRGIRYLATEIDAGRLKINGFYADWAMPTYHIVRFLLYAFMIAMIYPYLPGANSGVFQGVSVFVGLIVSLGSSTVIGNIIAGFVITYMRAFKQGDRIKLNDTVGNVIEKTAIVTRLMSSQTVNYSSSARSYGLIIHSEVTIGYDTPWRQVHQLLIDAAKATSGVMPEPAPFVLETSLSDFYPVYQINAYIQDADKMTSIYSDLHQNIQDYFDKAGVEILSPHYTAFRNGNASTIPKEETPVD